MSPINRFPPPAAAIHNLTTTPIHGQPFNPEIDPATAQKVKIFAYSLLPIICLLAAFSGCMFRRYSDRTRRRRSKRNSRTSSQSGLPEDLNSSRKPDEEQGLLTSGSDEGYGTLAGTPIPASVPGSGPAPAPAPGFRVEMEASRVECMADSGIAMSSRFRFTDSDLEDAILNDAAATNANGGGGSERRNSKRPKKQVKAKIKEKKVYMKAKRKGYGTVKRGGGQKGGKESREREED